MKLPIFQIDAFTTRCFSGNPAAICLVDEWPGEHIMQAIAAENNLSETAFVRGSDHFDIRWFTPNCEVDLCGHATLAAAHILFLNDADLGDSITFESRSGVLTVTHCGHKDGHPYYQMDFPALTPKACPCPEALAYAFNNIHSDCLVAMDYLLICENTDQILNAQPDLLALKQLDKRGVILSAQSSDDSYALRFFAPRAGINEDPVTGSAFTQCTPYWAKILNQNTLSVEQLSQRGGNALTALHKNRVLISGSAALYLAGEITV